MSPSYIKDASKVSSTVFLHMEEDICKQSAQKGINLQNMQTAHAVQYKKKNPIKKWMEDLSISPKKTYRWPRGT